MTLSRSASKLKGSEAAPPLRLAPVLTGGLPKGVSALTGRCVGQLA